jgi:hypothetical protein
VNYKKQPDGQYAEIVSSSTAKPIGADIEDLVKQYAASKKFTHD